MRFSLGDILGCVVIGIAAGLLLSALGYFDLPDFVTSMPVPWMLGGVAAALTLVMLVR